MSAVFSDCGRYRYVLGREWRPGLPLLTVIMLNPSTADAELDDPTIRRCRGFATREGFGGMLVLNLYGLRATDPRELWRVPNSAAVGPENDEYLDRYLHAAARSRQPVLAAWGAHARPHRVEHVVRRVGARDVMWRCLGVTKSGAPKHPLYLPKDAEFDPWDLP